MGDSVEDNAEYCNTCHVQARRELMHGRWPVGAEKAERSVVSTAPLYRGFESGGYWGERRRRALPLTSASTTSNVVLSRRRGSYAGERTDGGDTGQQSTSKDPTQGSGCGLLTWGKAPLDHRPHTCALARPSVCLEHLRGCIQADASGQSFSLHVGGSSFVCGRPRAGMRNRVGQGQDGVAGFS